MTLPVSRLWATHDIFDRLRVMKRGYPGEAQRFAALFTADQSGTSIHTATYIQTRVVDDAIRMGLFPPAMNRAEIVKSQRLALRIAVSTGASERTLAKDILTLFGDLHAFKCPTHLLWQRVLDHTHRHRTEIIFIEKIQHLYHRMSGGAGSRQPGNLLKIAAATDALKTLLIRGRIPLVLVATPEVRGILYEDPQLWARCTSELNHRN
jgi:hypothetical protein